MFYYCRSEMKFNVSGWLARKLAILVFLNPIKTCGCPFSGVLSISLELQKICCCNFVNFPRRI